MISITLEYEDNYKPIIPYLIIYYNPRKREHGGAVVTSTSLKEALDKLRNDLGDGYYLDGGELSEKLQKDISSSYIWRKGNLSNASGSNSNSKEHLAD